MPVLAEHLQIFVDRTRVLDRMGELQAVARIEFPQQHEIGFHRLARHLHVLIRREAPAGGAGRVDVQVGEAGPGREDGAIELVVEVLHESGGGGRHIVAVVHHHQQRQILRVLGLAVGAFANRGGRGPGPIWGAARSLHAGVHIAFVVDADIEDFLAALGRAGERLEAHVGSAAITGQCHRGARRGRRACIGGARRRAWTRYWSAADGIPAPWCR